MKSLTYALERINLNIVFKKFGVPSNSRALILPGVSAAGNVMSNIRKPLSKIELEISTNRSGSVGASLYEH